MQLRTKTPIPKRPVVDYLRFILPWACDPLVDPKVMYERAHRRIATEIENGTCKGSFAGRGRYRFVFSIPLPSGTKATVWIGALNPVRQKGGISVALNPRKLEPGDAEHFHEVMERIVGRSYKSLLRRALINRVDFAVDIVHARLDRMLVLYSGPQQFTVFGKTIKKGVVETYNFGSERSPYMTAVYDKNIERRHRAVKAIAKHGLRNEPLTANFIKQLEREHSAPPVVRVEVRGMKLRGLPLHDLHKMANRFARFTFADLNATGKPLPKKMEAAFMSQCRDRGVKVALDHYKGTPDVRTANAFWRSHRVDWWKPEPMMKQACDALRGSGIFPVEAFVTGDGASEGRSAKASKRAEYDAVPRQVAAGATLSRTYPKLAALTRGGSGWRRHTVRRIG